MAFSGASKSDIVVAAAVVGVVESDWSAVAVAAVDAFGAT
jgi:hypothetical protein